MLERALRRHCPRCDGEAFDGWFTMRDHCPRCGLRFEREPGYWVGAVIINTAIIFATFLVVFGGLIVLTYPDVPWGLVLAITIGANVVVPIVVYPLSRTIWLALEMSWHPLEPGEIEAARTRLS